jgi:histidinol-phosphate aminotransferase
MAHPTPKRTIQDISPYRPGKAKIAGIAAPIKLSANENAFGCSPAARAAFIATADQLHLYPDSRAAALREALARKLDLDPARIVFGAGSDEVFSLACQAFLSPGDVMVQPQYAFAAWAIAARAAGAEVISAPERAYAVDVDAMLDAIDARVRIVFVANPASPTGTSVPFAEIERLHAGLREDIILVLDGAYAEFAADGGRNDWSLATAPNVIITRTFSKLYGLANLRVGWGYCPAPIADVLNRIRLPFNVSALAQAAAIAALGDEAFAARSAAHAAQGREALSALLLKVGLQPLPATANFVTARVPADFPITAAEIDRRLAEQGVLVRALDNYGMPDCLRITIGADDAMLAFERALMSVLP